MMSSSSLFGAAAGATGARGTSGTGRSAAFADGAKTVGDFTSSSGKNAESSAEPDTGAAPGEGSGMPDSGMAVGRGGGTWLNSAFGASGVGAGGAAAASCVPHTRCAAPRTCSARASADVVRPARESPTTSRTAGK